MSLRLTLAAMIFLLPGISIAASSGPAIPDTPAGHTLGAWLAAFNSGDRASIESFDKAHAPWLTLDRAMDLRASTGGYDLLSIKESDDLWIIFRAKEKVTPKEVIGRLVLDSGNRAVISHLRLQDLSPDASFEDDTLDAKERGRVIESVSRLLDEFYVFPDVAKRMSAVLRIQEKRGKYRKIAEGDLLAVRLTDDLLAVSHDKHLSVRFSSEIVPPDDIAGPSDPLVRERLASNNCGFEKAEHLAPNIGYLKFNFFADPEICASTAAAAMNFLADSDALILDLRDNHGGMGGMVEFISSYLFAEATHLDDVYRRRENATYESWTLAYVPGKKFVDKPVLVLTSKRTFSAAEDLCYALKNLKRAALIGETTGGGAHPVDPHRIDDHFSIIVPSARSISPITKTDWEGMGVEPDVKVAAADALDEALKRARDQTASAGSPR
jgi:hypothetical protein